MTIQSRIKNNNTENIKLSIQVRLNGLSFCILNFDTGEIIWYKKEEFPKENNPVKILQKIELIYEKEKMLEQPINEVVVLFSNELYSLIPSEYFIEEEASNFIKFNTKILKTDVVAHDILSDENLVNVYIPYTNITNYFFDKYGEYEFKHSTSILVQEVKHLSRGKEATAFLNNNKGYYDLVILKEGQLLLSNTFNYETPEDFIYYLLFTAEQLKLDPSEFYLYLFGNIDKEAPEYDITYNYIKNVEFLDLDLNISPEEYRNKEFQREEFILLKSLGCE